MSLATTTMNCIDTYKSGAWGYLLVKSERHIECSFADEPCDSPFGSEGLRQDCEDEKDKEAFFQLLRYELLLHEPDGSWRGLATWIQSICKKSIYECEDKTCKHEYHEYQCRGIPCLSFLVKKDSITSIFIEKLLSNPKLHAVVWNGLDGTLYKPREFTHKRFAAWIRRSLESESDGWDKMAGPSPEHKLTLEDFDLQHLGFEVYICQVAMAMEWGAYTGMKDEEFDDAIDKFSIVDEVVSVLKKAGVKSRDME